jgi:2-polyprenyl-6-methoxyphenol hydroxylase-like FAD-dependent oxidoreductase
MVGVPLDGRVSGSRSWHLYAATARRGTDPSTMPTSNRDHAVVLGGSITGLLAARVLASEYANVIVVERDRLPSQTAHRRGVPQGHHVHGILPRGRQVMEDLLPGLTAQMVAQGGLPADILGNVRWYLGGRRLRPAETGLTMVSASRPLLEGAVRARVRELPNVTVLDGYDIVGLRASRDRRRVTGARVTSVHGEGSRVLPADLVVDATGRGSRAPRWLAELGYAAVPKDRVVIDLTYASRLFRTPPQLFGDDVVVVTARFPGQKRSGVMQRLEGNRVLVTLVGVLGERPPLALEPFAAYARALAAPDSYNVVRASRPLGDAVGFRMPAYVRHRYERMPDLPAGFLVAGDAVCSFNPIYAQGMAVAALNAAALRDELRHGGEPEPERYYATVSRTLDAPWGMAVGADLAIAGVSGPALPRSPLTPEYLANLQRAAVEDATLSTALIRVNALVDPPSALLDPAVVERVERAQAGLVR